MTHTRYWTMTLLTAICGGLIAIERFAFRPSAAVWIAFGIAIVATVCSLSAFVVALTRENHAFAGASALGVLIGTWTIIETRTFHQGTAIWLAFACGVALLLVMLRALSLHETTIERVVHALEPARPREVPATVGATNETAAHAAVGTPRRVASLTTTMRSWMYWLAHMGIAIGGALIVLLTFALTTGTHPASARWIAFGIGIAVTCAAAGALADRLVGTDGTAVDGGRSGRLAAVVTTGASVLVGIAMIVTMIVFSGTTARWLAFAIGCGMVGFSLLAVAIHEFTSERVRHELEVARPSATAPAAAPTATTAPTPAA